LKFVAKWCGEWDWLVYSPSQDGAYCKFCALFCTTIGKQRSCPGKLVKVPFKNWKDAREVFREHEKAKYHSDCLKTAGTFVATTNKTIPSIDKVLDAGHAAQVNKNREQLKPIISTAIFLARRGLAFRGHRDSGPVLLNEPSERGEGNFKSLLRFRAQSGDSVLQNHLENAGENATYTSWQIQNEIITSMNKIILTKLVEKVKDAQWFSILVDETTDVGTIAQMTFCVRFVENEKVHEEFLQFIPVTDMTGKGLADIICKTINDLSLQPQFMVGQGYDGAGAMSGHMNGVQAIIKEKYPKALYVHCSSHCLNLCISEGCSVQGVRNCMGTIESAYNFFNTPKRQTILSAQIEKMDNDQRKKEKLKRMCPTRWVERHDSVQSFVELLRPILAALDEIKTWSDKKTAIDAQLLQCAIEKCDFFISLFSIEYVFSLTLPLSVYLQRTNLDLSAAMKTAMTVKNKLAEDRKEAIQTFAPIFQKASELCADLEIPVVKPRVTGRQTMRDNVPADSVEDYFRRSLFIPFIENTVEAFGQKFETHSEILSKFQTILQQPNKECDISDDIQNVAEFYDLETTGINGEVIIWQEIVKERKPKNAVEALQHCNAGLTPTVHSLLSILATIPVTTCTAERSFSSLKLLKTYLRNRTSEERLNGLASAFIHPRIPITEDEILHELAKKSRRINITL
jgi:hypothetical protein